MKITERCRFPANPETLLRMYTDPGFYPAKYARLGARNIKVIDCIDAPEIFSITVTREVPTELPAFARKFVAPMAFVTQTDRWDRNTRKGRVEVQVKALPARIGVVQMLEKAEDGCVKVMDWELDVTIPLLGGRLEKMLLEQMLKGLKHDTDVSLELLGGY